MYLLTKCVYTVGELPTVILKNVPKVGPVVESLQHTEDTITIQIHTDTNIYAITIAIPIDPSSA